MNLQEWLQAEKKIYTDKDLLRYPAWKIISTIGNSGLVIMTDGTIAKNLSRLILTAGDRVLVYRNNILQVDWKKKNIHVPVLFAGRIYIICISGTTTNDCEDRLYYLLVGNTLQETSNPAIIDDGKYGIIFDIPRDDPDDYQYEIMGDEGIGIAAVSNGIAAKDSTQSRYILNAAMEDEIWKAWEWTVQYGAHLYDYDFLQLEDSLILNPLKVKSKPFVSRYVDDGIITIHHRWGESVNNVLNLDSYLSDNFHDSLPIIKRIYYKAFEKDNNGEYIREYKAIEDTAAVAAACNFYSDRRKIQDIIRAKTFDWYTSKMAEPLQHELYDFDNPYEEKEKLYRSPYPDGNYCAGIDNDYKKVYWVDGDTISCKTLNPTTHKITRSGLDTISNDIKKPFTIDENGKLTYVRFQKDTELTQSKTGIYLADELVEESGVKDTDPNKSGWEDVIKLYGNTDETFNVTAELQPGGNLLQNQIYYYRITAYKSIDTATGSINYNIKIKGNTGSYEVFATTNETNKSVKLTWDKVKSEENEQPAWEAEGYIIYRSTSRVFSTVRRMVVVSTDDALEWTDTNQDPDPELPYGSIGVLSELNGCPIYVRKTAYQILHAHQEQNFKAIVYRKTFYQSHSSELLDYKIYRSWIGDYVQVRKSAFISKTTFHIAIRTIDKDNKVIYKIIDLKNSKDLPYKCDSTEHQLTALSVPYSGLSIPTVAHLSKYAWCDVSDKDNINLTRIFTSEITGQLLIGFDVFPAEWNHNLVREEIGTSGEYALVGKYDDSEYPFPPASDGKYEDVKDRKWLLFDTAGDYIELTPPDVNRINGLGILEV